MKNNSIENNKLNIYYKIVFICFILMEIYISLPILKTVFNGTIGKLFFIILAVICIFMASVYSNKWFNFFLISIFPVVVIYILIVLLNYLFGRYTTIKDIISSLDLLLLYFFISIGSFFYIEKNDKYIKIIIGIFIICLYLTLLTTLRGLFINGNYSRMLSSSSTSESIRNGLRRMNIGAYDFIYSLIMLCFIFGKTLSNIKTKKTRAFIGLLIFISIFCIIKSNFTMALLLLLLSFIIFFIPINVLEKKYVKKIIILFFVLLFVARPLGIRVLKFFDNYYASVYMKYKIEGLMSTLNGQEDLEDVTLRVGLIENSKESFAESPFIGKGIIYHNFSVVGGHSQVMDDLARYGLIGYFIIIIPIFIFFRNTLNKLNNKAKNCIIVVIIQYIALSIFNVSLPYYISLTVFVIIPLWLKMINENEKDIMYEEKN